MYINKNPIQIHINLAGKDNVSGYMYLYEY